MMNWTELNAKSYMMKKLLFFVVFLVSGFNTNGQQLEKQPLSDEHAVIADLLYLSKTHLEISQKQAIEYAKKSIEKSALIGSDSLRAMSFKACGVAYYYSAHYIESLSMYDSSLFYFKKNGKQVEIANILNNKGIVLSDMKLHIQAIEMYLRAEEIYQQLDQTKSLGNISNNIGTLYFDLNAFDQALSYFRKASNIYVTINNKNGQISTHNNIGSVFREMQHLDSALFHYEKSKLIAIEIEDRIGLADASLNIGNIYVEKNNPKTALKQFETAKEIYAALERNLGRTYLGLGNVAYQMNNAVEAIKFLDSALREARLIKDIELQLNVLNGIVKASELKGDIPNAYKTLKQYVELESEFKALFDSTAINSLKARFQVKQKIDEIELLKNEKAIQDALLKSQQQISKRNRLLAFIILGALLVTISYLFTYFRMFKLIKAAKEQVDKRVQMHEKTLEELSKSNDSLREKEALLRTLINATPDLICFKDGQGKWIQANKAILELFDLSNKDYLNHTDQELSLLSPDFKESFETCLISDDLCWQKQTTTRTDEPITDRNRNTRIFDTLKIPLFKPDGSRKGIIILGREITDRKENETRLKTALSKAEESDRLKSAFLTNMSYEIRTPLNAILGFSNILKQDNIHQEQARQFLDKIIDNGSVLLHLIEDILDLSMIEAGEIKLKKEAIEMESFLQDIVDDCKSLAQKKGKGHLKVIKTSPGDKIFVASDPKRLKQIICNLTDNAIKFTEEGLIEIGFEPPKSTFEKTMKLFVRDTGIGIEPEQQDLMFVKFSKIDHPNKKVYSGAGLGLNIVEQLCSKLGGEVKLFSDPKKGTYVEVSLPFEKINSPNLMQGLHKALDDFQGKHILIVEDVDASFDLLKMILLPIGAQITRARDGEEAVAICKENINFDLVLMDIQLPGMNGLEVTRLIKKIHPQLPVIAQTAFAMHDDKEACFAAGCDGYISKPIKAQLLLPVLKQFL